MSALTKLYKCIPFVVTRTLLILHHYIITLHQYITPLHYKKVAHLKSVLHTIVSFCKEHRIFSMSTYSYMAADPQMVPSDLLDVILPQEIHTVRLDILEEDYSGAKDDEEEDIGILWKVSSFIFSPIFFVIYLIDTWVEGRVKKIIKKTTHLRYLRQ